MNIRVWAIIEIFVYGLCMLPLVGMFWLVWWVATRGECVEMGPFISKDGNPIVTMCTKWENE